MASLNSCNFIGRVGKPPETRYSASGDAITNITLAVDDSYKDKNGEKIDKCEWVNVTFYRKLADVASKYLIKGSLVFVSGKMETRKYTDKNGVEKYATSIIAHDMQMLGSKPAESGQSNQANNSKAGSGFEDLDSDLPF
jgi:single-strand DNA-binding protein